MQDKVLATIQTCFEGTMGTFNKLIYGGDIAF
jgi:hypothetical protein